MEGEIGSVGVTRDITELKEYQRKLEESNRRLEQFAYVASHDLQEPLRMVSNYLQLIESRYADELDEDGHEFIEFAVDGADRMREMIEGLLAYSRIDTEARSPELTDAEAVVENVLRDLALRIRETDAHVDVGSLPTVHADPNQLEQVFQNLLSNAIKYRGEEPPRIDIWAERDAGEWVVHVADNGIGMDPGHTDRIFEVFHRLHTHEEYPGTGIGLALCRKIIGRHGGDIWVESEPGEGSTFHFTIPIAEKR
jgi:light-regulated signal transduction histidine kinase (bacteriophytochrome)